MHLLCTKYKVLWRTVLWAEPSLCLQKFFRMLQSTQIDVTEQRWWKPYTEWKEFRDIFKNHSNQLPLPNCLHHVFPFALTTLLRFNISHSHSISYIGYSWINPHKKIKGLFLPLPPPFLALGRKKLSLLIYFSANSSVGIHMIKFLRRWEKSFCPVVWTQAHEFWLRIISYKGQWRRDDIWQQNMQPITVSFKGQTASDLLLYVNFTMTKEQMFWRD
jgi:hypothetical protein